MYAPTRLLEWQLTLPVQLQEPLLQSWILAAAIDVALSIAMIRAWRRGAEATNERTSHGTAYWGDPQQLANTTGVIVGRSEQSLLRLDGEGHVLTVAPTRSGKGVSCVIPNLLDHPGSLLITDPKGENYAVTAKWRRRAGHDVFALDPFDLVEGLASYNPLDLVDISSPDAIDDARMLADMLVLGEGKEASDQSFWNEEARGLLSGLILYAASGDDPYSRTLSEVRALLTQQPSDFKETLEAMSESEAAGGLIARAAARILQKADRERSGVISTAQSHTHFLDSPRMKRVLGSSTFDFGALKRDPTTIYLVLPTDRIESYSRWLRLMIACGLLAITRVRGQPREKVLFLLDEFAHLRRMQPVQRDIGLAGGYGVRFWLVLQDLSQLRSTYGEAWHTFLANVDLLQAFGTSDWDTAEYLSKMTGDATIEVATENQSRGVSRGRTSQHQTGSALSTAERGRRLLFADEVRRLPRDKQLLFIRGRAPLVTERADYLSDPQFATRASANPLYESVRA
ncbi:MAG TPA: type IV secretory system conjugative DNA transfer family protein [Gemmatimonadaceae bacterium]|jgi:type IV secretion system protein VirD4